MTAVLSFTTIIVALLMSPQFVAVGEDYETQPANFFAGMYSDEYVVLRGRAWPAKPWTKEQGNPLREDSDWYTEFATRFVMVEDDLGRIEVFCEGPMGMITVCAEYHMDGRVVVIARVTGESHYVFGEGRYVAEAVQTRATLHHASRTR